LNLETIQEMWEKDSKIDDVMLDESSLKIPQLHMKYLALYNEFSLLSKKTEHQLKTLQHKKWLYYSGKEVPEDAEPFPHKVIKSDVYNWMGVDEDIQKVEMKVEYYKVILNALTEILKQVHQMTYHIKQCIEWRRFVNGV
jgi:hypothetical protein